MESHVISDELLGALAESRLFRGLPATALESALREARRRDAQARGFFFLQGDPAAALYVLTRGRVKLTRITSEGHQAVLRVAGPGDLFGAIAALSGTVYPVAAEALEDSQAIYWDRATVVLLLERFPQIAVNALRLLASNTASCRTVTWNWRPSASSAAWPGLLRLTPHVGRKVDNGSDRHAALPAGPGRHDRYHALHGQPHPQPLGAAGTD